MARPAAAGLALFLFIPLVLALYLRQPLGPGVSIVAGLVIMFGHRFVAAPWMARHAHERCVWCARALTRAAASVPLPVRAGGREVRLACCGEGHARCSARFLTFIDRYRVPVGVGIFVPLVVLLAGSLARAAGYPLISPAWNAWQFRTFVALTVVTTSFAWRGVANAASRLRSPFPLHNLFLLGIRNTLWVFRIVGAWWLVMGLTDVLGG